MEWTDFLTYAAGPGVNAIVGVLLSEVVEVYFPGFAGLLPRWKRVAFFLLCMIVPLLASVLGVATAGWLATWVATYWPAVVAGGLAFGSGTLVHTRKMRDKANLRQQLSVAEARIRVLQGDVGTVPPSV